MLDCYKAGAECHEADTSICAKETDLLYILNRLGHQTGKKDEYTPVQYDYTR